MASILAPGGLSVLFLPVYEVGGADLRPHYVEALIRGPKGSTVEAPEILFEYARKKNQEAALDRACIETVLRAAQALPSDLRLGLNVNASTMALDPEFLNFLADAADRHSFPVHRLVIEIVDAAAPVEMPGLQNALAGLRSIGAEIALDDVGLGQSNYMMILECRADYFKIDRYFVHGAGADFHRQAVLTSLSDLAKPFGARVVAEGVETLADLEAVRILGIDLVQGHLFEAEDADDRSARGPWWQPNATGVVPEGTWSHEVERSV